MNSGDSQSRRHRVVAQPTKAELITSREDNQRGRGCRDFREGKRELDRRMHGLTGLDADGQVSTGNDKKATRQQVLTMRHIAMLAQPTSPR